MQTAAPAPPEVAQQAPTVAPEPPTTLPTEPPPVVPTDTPVLPTVAPTNTPVPPTVAPTNTQVPPTIAPTNTPVPPTVAPTNTSVPPTTVPPTHTPTSETTQESLTPVAPVLVPPDLLKENPEQVGASGGMATLQGRIDFIDMSDLTLTLANGDYFSSIDLTNDGEFWFPNVPNGTYRLSINGGGGGDTCAEITISVPEGHRTHTYNYRFDKMQCTHD